MKLKKKVKRAILLILLSAILAIGLLAYLKYSKTDVKTVKTIDKIKGYGYVLKESKPKEYKKMFYELKDILSKDKVDKEKYAKQISKMFIYDFYSLDDKLAKTDVGGPDFVYPSVLENFMLNAESTYYKYLESNVYKNRKQVLPKVTNIKIESIDEEEFEYSEITDPNTDKEKEEEKLDEKAYIVEISWDYTDTKFDDYQKEATLTIVHKGKKLYIAELINPNEKDTDDDEEEEE